MALRRAKWTHEFNTFAMCSANFLTAKDFATTHEVAAEFLKLHRRSYDGLRNRHEWPDVFTIRAEFKHFLYRVAIFAQFRDSVTPA